MSVKASSQAGPVKYDIYIPKKLKTHDTEKTGPEIIKKTGNEKKIVFCPVCGNKTSIYYFSSVIENDGKKILPKCTNCGYFDDPE